jgi:multidrug efflux pump subunit AcrA (membrane-fusion protein)
VGETVSAGTSTVSSAAELATSSGTSSGSGGSGSSSGFITVTNLGRLDVVVSFPEADIGQVAVGQPAAVTLAALPSTELPGRVTWISPTSTVSNNVVDYDVTISLGDPPATVRDGMTADVSVVTATESGVLYVPSSAITTVGTRSTVTVLQGKKEVTKQVVTGLVGSSTTQIVSGLTVGEKVVLPTVSVSPAASSSSTSGGGGAIFGGGGGFVRRLGG